MELAVYVRREYREHVSFLARSGIRICGAVRNHTNFAEGAALWPSKSLPIVSSTKSS
jgi:hypothetical protein